LYLTPSGNLLAEVSSWDTNSNFTQTTTTSTIPLNQWTHIAFVRTATAVQFYFNGVAQPGTAGGNATPSQVTNVATSAPFRIGTRDQNSIGDLTAYYHGQIDEVGVYSRALTQSDVQ